MSKKILLFFSIISIFGLYADKIHADSSDLPLIIFTVPDLVIESGRDSILLPIYMDNFFDTIAGFQFGLKITRPDLVKFDFINGGFDTAGTLTSGFQWVDVVDQQGDQSVIVFRCIANFAFIQPYYAGFPMQEGGVAVNLLLKTVNDYDTLDNGSLLNIVTPFDFVDPNGKSIGIVQAMITDTLYYKCTLWVGGECASVALVSPDTSDYDYVVTHDTTYYYLDTNLVISHNGSLLLTPFFLNCDNDGSQELNIVDLTCLVKYFFKEVNNNVCSNIDCDADKSGETNIADLTYLVNFFFKGGPPPK